MESPTIPNRLEPTGSLNQRDLGDEFLFYDRDGDRVHVLNGVAREVFLLCDGNRTKSMTGGESKREKVWIANVPSGLIW